MRFEVKKPAILVNRALLYIKSRRVDVRGDYSQAVRRAIASDNENEEIFVSVVIVKSVTYLYFAAEAVFLKP